jgi:hypothetical protein
MDQVSMDQVSVDPVSTDRVSTDPVSTDREGGRDRDRAELPEPMRRDVRLLGDLLGEVVRDSSGPGCWPTWSGCGTP